MKKAAVFFVLSWALIVSCAGLVGCASVSNPYVEPRKEPGRTSVLEGSVFSLPIIYARRVNIATIDGKTVHTPICVWSPRQRFYIDPGTHTIEVKYWSNALSVNTYSLSDVQLRLQAEPGRRYQIRSSKSGSLIRYRIVDKQTGQTVAPKQAGPDVK